MARDVLESDPIAAVLAREHERAVGDEDRLSELRETIDAAKADGTFTYDLYPPTVYLAIEPAMGRFMYLAAKSIGARRIVEFGTSFGISTIYLAAAARESGGEVIGSELIAEKAERAEANLGDAGLADCTDIRVGDAMETLSTVERPVDMLFLDGWKDLYLPVLKMIQPKLRPGALVLADNIATFQRELEPYVDYVSDTAGPFRAVNVPFASGLSFALYEGETGAV